VSIRELERLIPYLEQHDIISGYRLQRQDPPSMWVRWFQWLTNWLLALDLADMDCRISLLHADVIEKVELTATSPLIHTELYARACAAGAVCVQAGVYAREGIAEEQRKTTSWMNIGALMALLYLAADLRRNTFTTPFRLFPRLFWNPKVIWTVALLVVAKGAWLLLRRRDS
jgi:hypothetical protein